MRAIVTVGLGFGDEGKGATVDHLVRQLGAELVVRYSGGAQAGHNVELPDGRRHTFSQFGAGTLAGADTFLGPRMVISPTSMVPEADHLRTLGIADPFATLRAHPDCLIASQFHVLMNRLREMSRGDRRHGSCGMGIGEARHYWMRYGSDALFATDLDDPRVLRSKLALAKERFLLEMQQLPRVDREFAIGLHDLSTEDESRLLQMASNQLQVSDELPDFDTAVFEGSQGVLLDEWKGFHPYTTWSTVTAKHAIEMLAPFADVETTILGITRAYSTRHGAGPFPAYCEDFSQHMNDIGNPENDWQGKIRFGPLDLVLLEYAARVTAVDGIIVTGLDQLPANPRIVTAHGNQERLPEPITLSEQERLTGLLESATPTYLETTQDELLARIDQIAPVMGSAHGPSSLDREYVGQDPSRRSTLLVHPV